MNVQTIEPKPQVAGRWKTDARVGACFRGLYEELAGTINGKGQPRIVGITAPTSGEGVSTVARQLAIAAAEQHSVLLIDAGATGDVHRQILAEHGDLEPIDSLVRASRVENLSLCSLCRVPLETPEDARTLIHQLAADHSFVVIDLPPWTHWDGALPLVDAADGILLVVDASRAENAGEVAAALARANGSLLGLVINRHEQTA